VTVTIDYLTPTLTPKSSEAPPPTPENTGPALANAERVAGILIDPSSKKRLKIYAVVFLLVLVSLSVGLVLTLLKLIKLRQILQNQSANSQNSNQQLTPINESQQNLQ